MLLLGAHMSIAGGIDKAIDRAESVDSDAVQVFTKNQRQWKGKPLSDEEATAFEQRLKESSIRSVIAHDSYLINLASPKDDLWEKSIAAFRDELERCEQLGIPFLVAHPGSHTGSGREAGIDRIVQALDRVHQELPGYTVRTLLETTAGQGSSIGGSFQDLADLLDRAAEPDRLAVCFDTCHTFVAGYDCRTPEAYNTTMSDFEQRIGCHLIEAFHFNDAVEELGSCKDRHAHIGDGCIGTEGLRNFMNDPRFEGKPALLETPKDEDLEDDRKAIALLRSLVA